jgi:hypothetical protein
MSFFDSHRGLFALILPYFAFILPFYFPITFLLCMVAIVSTRDQGSIFRSENYIYSPPPPSENDIFFPSRDMSFFYSHCGLFALILPYFAFILPFYFPFSNFLSPFFPFLSPFFLFLSPFFLFLLHFLPFSLGLFIFFPPNDIG